MRRENKVAYAKLIVGQHTESKDNLLNLREVTFSDYILTSKDTGDLTITVEANTGGTAIGAQTIPFTAHIQIEKPGDNKLKPGTGTIGPNGTALLINYEDLGEQYKVYENGILVAILSRDVEGKGNITYGYGILFINTPEEIKRLKDTYNLEFAVKVSVPIILCEQMYQDYVNENLPALLKFTKDNDIWLNQNQLDALIMHRHLAYRLGERTQELLVEMFKDKNTDDADLKQLYWEKLHNALLDDIADKYKNDKGEWDSETAQEEFEKYKSGWTNRILDELELFFDGDAMRNH